MTTGCRGSAAKRDESRLGEESLEEGSEEREYGDRGLASGDTPKISGKIRADHNLSRHINQAPAGPGVGSEVFL